MRLSVNFISGGKYWKVGDDIPDELVPEPVRRYAATEEEAAPVNGGREKILARSPRYYVRRGQAFRRVEAVEGLVRGEARYERVGVRCKRAGHITLEEA
jgi:hypothetical protein